jgi:hypothetical protein
MADRGDGIAFLKPGPGQHVAAASGERHQDLPHARKTVVPVHPRVLDMAVRHGMFSYNPSRWCTLVRGGRDSPFAMVLPGLQVVERRA